jgi:hypothetical protein
VLFKIIGLIILLVQDNNCFKYFLFKITAGYTEVFKITFWVFSSFKITIRVLLIFKITVPMVGTIQDNIIRIARSRYCAAGIFAVIKHPLVTLPITGITKRGNHYHSR